VAAAGVLLWRRGSLYGARRASGFYGIIRVSLIEKNYYKKRDGLFDYARVKEETENIADIRMCMRVCKYMCGSYKRSVTYI
jgi:hypothetical protein